MNRHDEILTGIYHRGQEKIWDGRKVLSELVQQHGNPNRLDDKMSSALGRIFTMILRGEEAAWQISLQLAAMLESTPARLAATSQAHDEARHFYVLQNYLDLFGHRRCVLPETINTALSMVVSTDNLSKKLLGMQLMVEPVALTIFQEIRKKDIEPVLSGLLPYYERDEARHVALGVQHLPVILNTMNPFSLLDLTQWQVRLFMLELKGLRDMKKDFETIGLCPNELFSLAERKQLDALEDVANELGWSPKAWKPLQQLLRYQKQRILG